VKERTTLLMLEEYLMNIEANKALVRRYIELWETGNLALADEILAAEYVDHSHPHQAPGPEPVKREVMSFRTGFPDAHITIEQIIGEGLMLLFATSQTDLRQGDSLRYRKTRLPCFALSSQHY
jgi:hypothetical protein